MLVLRAARRLREKKGEDGLVRLQLEFKQVLELVISRRPID
mgnify:CR=1 FL=1